VRSASRKDAQFNKDISVDYPEEVGRIFCKKNLPPSIKLIKERSLLN
jgi:hypothetical protein